MSESEIEVGEAVSVFVAGDFMSRLQVDEMNGELMGWNWYVIFLVDRVGTGE